MNKQIYQGGGIPPVKKKKKKSHKYEGKTTSKRSRERVHEISEGQKEPYTKKQKRATKRIMRKSDRMYRAEERQSRRKDRTGSKEGRGVVGKIRGKVIKGTHKRRTKRINKQMDKLTSRQAFNVGRRYTPGKTYMYKGKERSEKTRSEVRPPWERQESPTLPPRKDAPPRQRRDQGPRIPKNPRRDRAYPMRTAQTGGALDEKNAALSAAGMIPMQGMQGDMPQKRIRSQQVDYNAALTALGLIPGLGAATKVAKTAKRVAKAKGKSRLKGAGAAAAKALTKAAMKKKKKQTGGFNTGTGSWIESSSVVSID